MSKITPEELKEIFQYDPDTGRLYWRRYRSGIKQSGIAGYVTAAGRRMVRVNGRYYYVARVAWAIMTGSWPTHEIDHIDKDKLNDCWSNLREATRSENMGNSPVQRKSKSGFKGVTRHTQSGKWVANIRVHGKLIYLGIFEDKYEAAAAYAKAAIEHFGEFANA